MMNYRQKLGYTALGAMIMLVGMSVDSILSPLSVAQSNGVFDEIQCSTLTVVDEIGEPAISLSSYDDGNAMMIYNRAGKIAFGVAATADDNSIILNRPTGKEAMTCY